MSRVKEEFLKAFYEYNEDECDCAECGDAHFEAAMDEAYAASVKQLMDSCGYGEVEATIMVDALFWYEKAKENAH